MKRKEHILRMISRLPADVSYEQVIYHLDVLRNIEQGEEDFKRGRVIDHDELFARLLNEDAKNDDSLDRPSRTRSGANSHSHQRKRNVQGSRQLHRATSKGRSKA